jgi:hypothetical protein
MLATYGKPYQSKRVTRPRLGFKSFDVAQCTIAGVELMHMIKKGQMAGEEGEEDLTPAAPALHGRFSSA